MIPFLYIFLLFILCTPSFLFKTKSVFSIYIVHSLIFTFILYMTYNLVKGKTLEGNETMSVNLSMENSKEIIDFVKTLFGIREKKMTVEIINDLSAMDREIS